MSSLLTLPIARITDANGDPVPGAHLHCYLTTTTTPTDVYTTSALSVAHANPVVADANGLLPAIYLDPAVTYRFKAKTSAGVDISGMDFDPVVLGSADSLSVTQNITSPTSRTVTQVLRDAPWKLEDKGGGPSKTAAQNSAAVTAIMAQFDAVTERGTLQLLEGVYQINTAILPPTYARNLTIQGYGPGRTILQQTGANVNGFTFPSGLNINTMFRDFTLQGAGSVTSYSGTGKGIYQPLGAGANDSYGLHFENIWVANFGGNAIELLDPFTTNFNEVHINYCGGDGIIAGGNTIKAEDCYIHNLPENNAVGYRFFAGQAILINCNGVDDVDIWGRFGRSTSDSNDLTQLGSAADDYCSVTLIGCNIESWNTIGLWLSNGYLWIDPSCRIISKASATGVKAILARSHAGGFLGSIPQLGSGGSWANSRAVHALGTDLVPFTVIDGDNTQTQFTYYDDTAGADRTASVNGTTKVLTSRFARVTADQRWTNTAGYMAGAGGTVTQSTDKSTTVALSKATGEITMNNAALAAATIVSFTLTNGQIETGDHVLVQHVSGGTVGAYSTTAVAGSGSATIYVRNNTAGSLGEAIVLKFTVIKAATT